MQMSINPKNGDRIGRLAYGCMRFPRSGLRIDQSAVTELIRRAAEGGVNLFDTAYIYEGSEQALGAALQSLGIRDRVFISDKLPIYYCKKTEDFDKYLTRQLAALQTDHIDYYFMHMLGDVKSWKRLTALGIEEWLEKKRAEGCIRNIGFSFHGGEGEFLGLLKQRDWDFCMIQYNYMDEHKQAGVGGLRAAHAAGIPVFIMEPLRGGSLVKGLSEQSRKIFAKIKPERSLADWGLRWLYDQPEVFTVLSGMNALSQLEENIRVATETEPGCLTEAERDAYVQVAGDMALKRRVPCTACGYCLPCPRGVDIPTCFGYYNESFLQSYKGAAQSYMQSTGLLSATQSDASRCSGCGACEKHCPQKIAIRAELKKVKKRMIYPMLPVLRIARRLMKLQ